MTKMRIENVATTIVQGHAQSTSRDWSQRDHDLHGLIVRTLTSALAAPPAPVARKFAHLRAGMTQEAQQRAAAETERLSAAPVSPTRDSEPKGMNSQDTWEPPAPVEPPGSALPLEHSRSCSVFVDDECTCGLGWRVRLVTEQEMHAAWRKRAEEAESHLAALAHAPVATPAPVSPDAPPAPVAQPARSPTRDALVRALSSLVSVEYASEAERIIDAALAPVGEQEQP